MREEGDGSTLGSLQAELDMLHKQLAARLARKEGAVTEQLVSAMSKASVEDMVEEESVSFAKKRTPVAEEAEKKSHAIRIGASTHGWQTQKATCSKTHPFHRV